MGTYFGINLEFNIEEIHKKISNNIYLRQKAYICIVDGNVLARAHKDENYRKIINNSLTNICDGSSIAILANLIHHKKFKSYTGPEIFSYYVSKDFKQFFLGNTIDNQRLLEQKFIELGYNTKNFVFESLPFKDVEEFDYQSISERINMFSPDIIWVSLGAPKQELFIDRLFPFVDKGVLFAIGAAFNLFISKKNNKRAPKLFRQIHLEWLYRVIQEPKRIGKRALNYLFLIPEILFQEIKLKKQK